MATSEIQAAFSAGISEHFGIELKEYAPVYPRIFAVDGSDSKFVDVQGWEGYGAPVKKLPLQVGTFGESRQSFNKRYVHDTYFLGDVISDEDWDDDKYGVLHRMLPSKGGAMARSFRTLLETQHGNALALLGYTASAVSTAPDLLSLFNTAHPISAGNSAVTVANRPTTEVDLSVTGMQAANVAIRTQKAMNNYTFLENNTATLVVNPAMEYIAKQVCKATTVPYTADRTQNFLPDDNINIVSWPYFQKGGSTGGPLAGGIYPNLFNSWFVLGDTNYLQSYMRSPYKIRTDADIYVGGTVFTATIRFSLGWSDYRGSWGTLGS